MSYTDSVDTPAQAEAEEASKRYTAKHLIESAEAYLAVHRTTRNDRPVTIHGKNGVSVIVYEDNTIHRADVRLDLCKRMKPREAAKALGFIITA